jgi:hypothetical protein
LKQETVVMVPSFFPAAFATYRVIPAGHVLAVQDSCAAPAVQAGTIGGALRFHPRLQFVDQRRRNGDEVVLCAPLATLFTFQSEAAVRLGLEEHARKIRD